MITLHISMTVTSGEVAALERLYADVYIPAIAKQPGFRCAQLLRAYREPNAYEIDIVFDDEGSRSRWASSPEHEMAWPRIEAVCSLITSQGFDVVAEG